MKKRTALALTLAFALTLLLSACGSEGGGTAAEVMPQEEASSNSGDALYSVNRSEAEDQIGTDAGEGNAAAEVKLIYRADLWVETLDFDQAAAGLDELVASLGGYFESSSLYQGGYNSSGVKSASYVIRVPSDQFQSFLNAVGETENCRVVSQEQSAEDIGAQYYDTEARLATLRIQQERLQALLSQAAEMSDIIELENALAEVEYEIEQYSSTLNRYDSLVGYATVNLSLEQVTRLGDAPVDQESLGSRMARGFRSGLTSFVDGLADLAVWFSYHFIGVILFLLAAAAVAAVLVRHARRRAQRRRTPPEVPPQDGGTDQEK